MFANKAFVSKAAAVDAQAASAIPLQLSACQAADCKQSSSSRSSIGCAVGSTSFSAHLDKVPALKVAHMGSR